MTHAAPRQPARRTASGRMLPRGTLLQLALLGAVLLLGGCRDESPADTPAPPPAAVEQEPQLTPDELLAEAVRNAMLQAPALANQNISIAVVQSQVFLAGEVSASHLRDEAVAVAGSVDGVRGVQSKIRVTR